MLVHTDADWAGCISTRRSTSAGTIQLGGHTLKRLSSTQATVAMSSAESEYNAAVRGGATGPGMRSVARDLGITGGRTVRADSSATIGI